MTHVVTDKGVRFEDLPRYLQEEYRAMEAGELLPSLTRDIPFKTIYDPDIHKERLTTLFQLIFREDATVVSSLKGENNKASILCKRTVLDVIARLSNEGVVDVEMQALLQEFIVHRMNIYASDMVMLQYSVSKNEKKTEFSYMDIPHAYLVVLMKESPEVFKENEAFIHVKEERTDTGIQLPTLHTIVYIELDKCMKYVQAHGYPEETKELCEWLILIADTNSEEAKKVIDRDGEKQKVIQELKIMSQDREVLLSMFKEKYEEVNRNSELKEARLNGEKAGKIEGERIGKVVEKISLIRKNTKKNMESKAIADFLEVELGYVEEVIKLLEEFPESTDEELAKYYSK